MRRTLHWLWQPGAWLCWGLFLIWPPAAPAQAPVSELALKAALLFKLPHFVYRSAGSKPDEFTLCVLGADPFDGALDRLSANPIDKRPVRLLQISSVAEAQTCEFLFVAASEAGRLDVHLQGLSALTAVSVSDIEGFARAGGMVELALAPGSATISLMVNRQAARRQGIEFNAQLLRLAKMVTP